MNAVKLNRMKTFELSSTTKRYILNMFLCPIIVGCMVVVGFTSDCMGQENEQVGHNESNCGLYVGAHLGYDLPIFNVPYNELDYSGNLALGAYLGYMVNNKIGIECEYFTTNSNPKPHIPNQIYYGASPYTTNIQSDNLSRNFIGIGPKIIFGAAASRLGLEFVPKIGYSFLSGGDALVDATNPISGGTDIHLMNTGFEDGILSSKLNLNILYRLSERIQLSLRPYYLRHFGVHFDDAVDINSIGVVSIAHGESIFDHTTNNYTYTTDPPNIINQDPEKKNCLDLSSVGATFGFTYILGKSIEDEKPQVVDPGCNDCKCPGDKHKVVVTVRDEYSGKVIPGADVAIKDLYGAIVSTGTTNSFGVVDLGEIPHGDYTVEGNVYGVKTNIEYIMNNEFLPNSILQKEVLYSDLRFILKGTVLNKATRTPESHVVVSLANTLTGSVNQDNSGAKGEFAFQLDPGSSYEVVGIKENRLSDIERASTVGLTRSTTLFVDLELGVENFDCGRGTILDIKYEFDRDDILPESQFELDRLVRYMRDHRTPRVELSSHTDARGSHDYNQDLSQRRAQSAVNYIMSRGISRSRIIARGFGEMRPLNHCVDGIDCTEPEHRINRRTESKLLCE